MKGSYHNGTSRFWVPQLWRSLVLPTIQSCSSPSASSSNLSLVTCDISTLRALVEVHYCPSPPSSLPLHGSVYSGLVTVMENMSEPQGTTARCWDVAGNDLGIVPNCHRCSHSQCAYLSLQMGKDSKYSNTFRTYSDPTLKEKNVKPSVDPCILMPDPKALDSQTLYNS